MVIQRNLFRWVGEWVGELGPWAWGRPLTSHTVQILRIGTASCLIPHPPYLLGVLGISPSREATRLVSFKAVELASQRRGRQRFMLRNTHVLIRVRAGSPDFGNLKTQNSRN